MCEKQTARSKKGGIVKSRLREARRQELQQHRHKTPTTPPSSSSSSEDSSQCSSQDSTTQNQVLLELAWKTLILVRRNKLIQQKIAELKKETSEFIAFIMSNPVNRRRYLENIRLYGHLVSEAQQKIRQRDISHPVEANE